MISVLPEWSNLLPRHGLVSCPSPNHINTHLQPWSPQNSSWSFLRHCLPSYTSQVGSNKGSNSFLVDYFLIFHPQKQVCIDLCKSQCRNLIFLYFSKSNRTQPWDLTSQEDGNVSVLQEENCSGQAHLRGSLSKPHGSWDGCSIPSVEKSGKKYLKVVYMKVVY